MDFHVEHGRGADRKPLDVGGIVACHPQRVYDSPHVSEHLPRRDASVFRDHDIVKLRIAHHKAGVVQDSGMMGHVPVVSLRGGRGDARGHDLTAFERQHAASRWRVDVNTAMAAVEAVLQNDPCMPWRGTRRV